MRKDSENLAIIEKMKPEHEQLRNLKIRTDTELERGERDIAELKKELMESCGTDDLDAVRAKIVENYAANTAAVDEYVALFSAVKSALEAIDAEG